MVSPQVVKLLNASLDATPEGRMIFRGILNLDSLKSLQIDDYQRTLVNKNKEKLKEALANGSAPDIELGMRGSNFHQEIENGNTVIYLYDPVYIIDGLQRTSAALEMISQMEGKPHLAAVVHLETTKEWEKERFRLLNLERTKLSPNVLLRNMRDELTVIQLLYHLCTEEQRFVLHKRVSWNQYMKKGEVITATTLINALAAFQHHIGGEVSQGRFDKIAYSLQKTMDITGQEPFALNTVTFFDVIEEAWGIKNIVYTQSVVYLRNTFLRSLALVFSRHTNFWDGNFFRIDSKTIKQLSQFPIGDPNVNNLSSSGMQASKILYQLMIDHLNYGRHKQNRLTPRRKEDDRFIEYEEE